MMAATQGTEALVTQLADEIVKRLDKSYDLVYVDYRDQLTDTQVSALVRGDEWLDESWEFESDSRYDSAKRIIDELAGNVIREWSDEADADLDFILGAFEGDEWDRVRFEIEERDTGSWVEQLVRQTPTALLRINVIDEDHGYSFEEVTARRVLKDLGMRATRENIATVNYVLANASPGYSVLLGYWIVSADVSAIYELAHDVEEVEIVNPYLYLGNPFVGSGFISERPLDGTVRVKREELRTDKDAFGYAVDEIYGGLRASDFEAEIRPIAISCITES
jgi:hypothetical protein